jgi:hypothetical protein
VTTEPIKKYIQSIKAFEAGDRPGAEKLLAESLEIPKLNDYMKDNLGKLLNENEAALTIAIANAVRNSERERILEELGH